MIEITLGWCLIINYFSLCHIKWQILLNIFLQCLDQNEASLFFFPHCQDFPPTNVYLAQQMAYNKMSQMFCLVFNKGSAWVTHVCKQTLTDLILFVVLHRSLMALSLHRSRCTSSMKSNCSATRTFPTLTQRPQVQITHITYAQNIQYPIYFHDWRIWWLLEQLIIIIV